MVILDPIESLLVFLSFLGVFLGVSSFHLSRLTSRRANSKESFSNTATELVEIVIIEFLGLRELCVFRIEGGRIGVLVKNLLELPTLTEARERLLTVEE